MANQLDVIDANNQKVTINTQPIGAATIANAVPMALASNHPDISVQFKSLLSGEDQNRKWLRTTSGAAQYRAPIPASTVNKALGVVGAVGDFLARLVLNFSSSSNSAVYIKDGSVANALQGTAGTSPTGNTTVAVTSAATTVAITANQYAGNIINITYVPTSGVSTTYKRRIVSHNAFATGSTALSFIVTHLIPAGSNVSGWGVEDASTSFELVQTGQTALTMTLALDMVSAVGKWQITTDSGVSVIPVGNFT